MKLILLRHGQTEANATQIIQGHRPGSLSEKGHAQAQAAAKRLTQLEIDAVYCSDLQRTRQTLHYFLECWNKPVEYTEALRERSLGIYEGKHFSTYKKDRAESRLSHIEFRPEGGESLYDLKRRTDMFLEVLLKDPPGNTALLCSHGGTIVALLSSLLHLPLEDTLRHDPENASLSIVETNVDSSQRDCILNSVEHLKHLKND